MKTMFRFSLILSLFVGLFGSSHAMAVTNLRVNNITTHPFPLCATIEAVTFSGTFRGEFNDTGGVDIIHMGLYDANGRFLGHSIAGSFPIGVSTNFSGIVPFSSPHTPFSRPFTLKAHDTTSNAATDLEIIAAPVVAEISFDPINFMNGVPCDRFPTGFFPPPVDPPATDGRLNTSSTVGAVYIDSNGVSVYSIDSASQGNLAAFASASQLQATTQPAQNTLIASSSDGRYAIFQLANGANLFQVNYGPDADGKVRVITFTFPGGAILSQTEYIGGPPALGLTASTSTASTSSSTTTTTSTAGLNTTPISGSTYVVQAGDNLFRIALRAGVDLNTLASINGITDPTRIFVGQVLTIP